MRSDQQNSQYLLMLNVLKPPMLATVDVTLMWVPFAIGRYLEASSNNKLPPGVPFFYQEIASKKQSVLQSLQKVMRESGPVSTLRQLYSGGGSYLISAYAPLVAAEYTIHRLATELNFDDKQATLLTGSVGGVVASFGETRMIQGKKLRGIFTEELQATLKNTRGILPTISRELLFSMVAISGLQSQLSSVLLPYLGQSFLLSMFASSLLCSPLLLMTQPPARVAAFMQAQSKKISTIQAVQSIWAEASKLVNQSEQPSSSKFKKVCKHIKFAFFPGGAFRTGSIIGTSIIYGLGNQIFKNLETKI